MPHDHAHGHDHGGHHHHGPPPGDAGRAFLIGIALNGGYVVVEAVFGLISGSMALVADAGHNLSDVLGLALAWCAVMLSRRQPTARRTYGMKASSTLAALANGALLLVAVGAIAAEAAQRIVHPAPISTGTVIAVAAVGVLINAGTALLFMAGRKDDINVRGAFLHMVADAALTVGVIVAAVLVGLTGALWLDPAIALVIAGVILVGTWGLLRDSVNLALGAVPGSIDPDAVRVWLAALPGVEEVHDLHIWAMGTTETAMTAHLVRSDSASDRALLRTIQHDAGHRFGIAHATVQLETPDAAVDCALRPDSVV